MASKANDDIWTGELPFPEESHAENHYLLVPFLDAFMPQNTYKHSHRNRFS